MTYHLGPIDPDRRAELFADARDEEPQQRPRRVLATVLALLVMALFGGGLWFAYLQGLRHTGGGDPANGGVPLIRADERPTKVKPEKPGGMEIPDRDKMIYNPIRPTVEHLLPPPEKPMARPAAVPHPSPQAEAPPPAAPAAANAPVSPPAGTPAPAARPQQQTAALPAKAPQQQPAAQAKPAAAGGTRLQLGSVRSEDAARQEWERIKRKNADLLGALSATAVRADLGDKGVYYRIQTGAVADPATAERMCSELKQRNIGCIIAR